MFVIFISNRLWHFSSFLLTSFLKWFFGLKRASQAKQVVRCYIYRNKIRWHLKFHLRMQGVIITLMRIISSGYRRTDRTSYSNARSQACSLSLPYFRISIRGSSVCRSIRYAISIKTKIELLTTTNATATTPPLPPLPPPPLSPPPPPKWWRSMI